jgi:hypothetical protein
VTTKCFFKMTDNSMSCGSHIPEILKFIEVMHAQLCEH